MMYGIHHVARRNLLCWISDYLMGEALTLPYEPFPQAARPLPEAASTGRVLGQGAVTVFEESRWPP